MSDDATLLRQYATERAEDAFAELVRRNLPFVYSAALRRLGGDAHRAQDVAQVVFCALARDAQRISRNPVLAGWFYTATRNAAIDVIRSEKRRRTREEEAHHMQQIATELDSPADWSHLRPVLDAAMDQLNERDREAVLLRFFQGRPFAEVGTLIGLSEDAARKRVERALEKLRDVLRPRGIASTSAALATLLANQTISAAPASLTATITGTALATGGAATAGAATFFAVTKLQAGIAAAIVAGGTVGLVTQQRVISDLRENQVNVQQQLARLTAENVALTRVSAASSRALVTTPTATASRPLAANPLEAARIEANLIPSPNPYVTPRAALPEVQLPPLPATPEIARQKADLHRRYDPFFRERGLTSAQAERVVELFVQQAIAREDLQESVRATGTPGDTPGVEKLRSRLYEPITRELHEILGNDGYQAYVAYMRTTFYRDGVMAQLLPQFTTTAPLTGEQLNRLVEVVAANDHPERVQTTDIGSRARVDWDHVVAQSRSLLNPQQLALLENYARRQGTVSP
jgi:RNA polymerase sigma factor (sigma-70 family)